MARVCAASVIARSAATARSGWQPEPKPAGERGASLSVSAQSSVATPTSVVASQSASAKPRPARSGEEAGDRGLVERAGVDLPGGPGLGRQPLEERDGVALDQLAERVQRRLDRVGAGGEAVGRGEERRLGDRRRASRCARGRTARAPARRWRGRSASAQVSGPGATGGGGAGRRDRPAGRARIRSAGSPKRSGTSGRSACQRSIASMAAETLAAAGSRPLPLATERPRAFGRTAAKTSMPVRSKPVSRAMPGDAEVGEPRAAAAPSVRAGASLRCVPSVKRLGTGAAPRRQQAGEARGRRAPRGASRAGPGTGGSPVSNSVMPATPADDCRSDCTTDRRSSASPNVGGRGAVKIDQTAVG